MHGFLIQREKVARSKSCAQLLDPASHTKYLSSQQVQKCLFEIPELILYCAYGTDQVKVNTVPNSVPLVQHI